MMTTISKGDDIEPGMWQELTRVEAATVLGGMHWKALASGSCALLDVAIGEPDHEIVIAQIVFETLHRDVDPNEICDVWLAIQPTIPAGSRVAGRLRVVVGKAQSIEVELVTP